MFTMSDPFTLAQGLLAGLIFGVLLQKGHVTRYAVIVGQFLLVDFTVLRVMFTAIVVGAIGVWGMLALGVIEHLHVKPAVLAANAIGGLIFGVGMSALGYCPGTGVGAAAEGSRHAAVGVVGMVFGALAWALAAPYLWEPLASLGDLGKVTLPDLLGGTPWLYVAILAAIAGGAFVGLRKVDGGAAV